MRALCSTAKGDWQTLEMLDLPSPSCGPDEVKIRVAASAINYPDALMIEDRYQFRPERPFAPGCEISGVVIEVGSQVSDIPVGQRVVALTTHAGGLAEEAVVKAVKVAAVPDTIPLDVASGLMLTYGTSWHALVDRAGLKAGETLLVLGAAGGVGRATIELGKALGARVVAGVSNAEKAEVAREAGADETFIYDRAPLDKDASRALAETLKKLAGPDGFDVIYDPIGGDYAEPALRAMAWQGRYLVIGFTVGIASIPMNLILLKGCQLVGVFWGSYIERNPPVFREEAAQFVKLYEEGKIAPLISSRHSLEDGGKAIAMLAERKVVGKAVVIVDDSL